MDKLLGFGVALIWGLTTACAAIGYKVKIEHIMKGIEPPTDWILVVMFTCACIFTVLAASLVEDRQGPSNTDTATLGIPDSTLI